MFQQQPPPHAQMQQQRKENYLSSDVQAREKLSQFVYEYLYQLGATKTAETFKNEFLAHNMPNLQIDLSSSSGPGFLYNWWSVFWDLYSAHPDKKDKVDATQEAKTYHKMMFPNYNNVPPDAAAMVNGGMYGPGGGAVFPNPAMGPGGAPPQNLPDGMFPNAAYYGPRGGPQPGPSSNQASPIPGGGGPPRYGQQGTRSGAPTPSSVVGVGGPNFPMGIGPPQMMTLNEQQQQLRLMMAARQQQQHQQQANQAVRMQMNNGGRAVRAQFNNAQYMDSPSGTPPFHNPLVHNGVGGGGGVMCPTTASLMSPAGAPGGAPQQQDVSQQQHQQHFMMANQVPVSMQSQFANHHDSGGGGGAVGTPGGGGGGTGPASVSAQNTMNNGNGGLGEQSGDGGGRAPPNGGGGANGPLHSLLNGTASDGGGGTEMKQSPPFSGGGGGGVNGGTPGSNVGGGGGGGSQTAGPSSVHSQSGGGGGQQQSQQQQSSSMGDGAMEFHQSSEEISKIKASLMDDFQQHQFQQQ